MWRAAWRRHGNAAVPSSYVALGRSKGRAARSEGTVRRPKSPMEETVAGEAAAVVWAAWRIREQHEQSARRRNFLRADRAAQRWNWVAEKKKS